MGRTARTDRPAAGRGVLVGDSPPYEGLSPTV